MVAALVFYGEADGGAIILKDALTDFTVPVGDRSDARAVLKRHSRPGDGK